MERSDTPAPQRQIACLDGLRGVAVLVVFLSHAGIAGYRPIPGLDCAGIGKSGVLLFYLLSAFLLTGPFLAADRNPFAPRRLADYSLRRVMRIYPLYSLWLLCGLATTWASQHVLHLAKPIGAPLTLNVSEFARHLALMEGKGVAWSIPVEFRYYLLLPVVAWVLVHATRRRPLPAIALMLGLIGLAATVWPQSEVRPNDPRLGPYLPVFLMGSLLAWGHDRWSGAPRRWSRVMEAAGLAAAVALAVLIPSVASFLTGTELPRDAFHHQMLLTEGLWCLVLLAALHGAGRLSRVLEWAPLRHLGKVCFGMYLVHTVVIHGIDRLHLPVAGWLLGWLMLAVSVAAATASYALIERPCLRIRLPQRSLSAETPVVPAVRRAA